MTAYGKLLAFPAVRRLMSDERWDEELKRMERKIERIRLARSGKADVKVIHVKRSKWVTRHRRAAHDRTIIVLRKK